ncbi:hypothetical protein [Rhizobium sp. 1399]|jgi:hypothetical protein|uniref:hypothetical protein n=1 Tax=Rhizobium sp. 1399 TaxID=2817758 RepID=UPI00285A3C52|nr:hypothetical protein [Rhizobium sp. 1399]MDR6667895.1 hypothetical protein [Rhizobium sp. 1399]
MDRRQKTRTFGQVFESRKPSADGEADACLEFESFQPFALSADGKVSVRLALTSDETLDLSTNTVCAARLAVALLDVVSRSGDLLVDLAVYDPDSGDQRVRIKPAASSAIKSES